MSNPYPIRSPLDPSVAYAQKDYNYVAPLDADGSNYPCKGYQNDQPRRSTATYKAGSEYNMTLTTGATHLGGSCQLSMSYDDGATFKVIKSMIGGCPLTTTYDFTVPASAPSGQALFAWTWQNHEGNREFYMNCAWVDIKPGSDRGSTASTAPMSSLPGLWVANLKSINSCTTKEGTDPVYPNPGSDVIYGDNMSGASPSTPGDCEVAGRAGDLTAGNADPSLAASAIRAMAEMPTSSSASDDSDMSDMAMTSSSGDSELVPTATRYTSALAGQIFSILDATVPSTSSGITPISSNANSMPTATTDVAGVLDGYASLASSSITTMGSDIHSSSDVSEFSPTATTDIAVILDEYASSASMNGDTVTGADNPGSTPTTAVDIAFMLDTYASSSSTGSDAPTSSDDSSPTPTEALNIAGMLDNYASSSATSTTTVISVVMVEPVASPTPEDDDTPLSYIDIPTTLTSLSSAAPTTQVAFRLAGATGDDSPCTQSTTTYTVTYTPSCFEAESTAMTDDATTSTITNTTSFTISSSTFLTAIMTSVPSSTASSILSYTDVDCTSQTTEITSPTTASTTSASPPSSTTSSSNSTIPRPPYAADSAASYLPCVPNTFLCANNSSFYTCSLNTPGSSAWTYGALRPTADGMECLPNLSPCTSQMDSRGGACEGRQGTDVPPGYYRDDRYVRDRPFGDCSPDGELLCYQNGLGFYVCDQGGLVDMGSVASGTECVNGTGIVAVD